MVDPPERPRGFYLDQNTARQMSEIVAALGHNPVRAEWVYGRRRIADAEHLGYAASHDLILLTHDSPDLALLHDAWVRWGQHWPGLLHAGILAMPQPQVVSHDRLSLALQALLDVDAEEPLPNQMYRLHQGVWWRREVELSGGWWVPAVPIR